MRIELKQDHSGTVVLNYSVMRAIINLGTIDEDKPFYTIPVSRGDFERTVARVEGLDLKTFRVAEDSAELHVDAELTFESTDALSQLFSGSGPGAVEITTVDGRTVYRHIVFSGNGSEIDADSKKMIETFFKDYEAIFTLAAPEPIESVSHGAFDGRNASVSFDISKVTLEANPVIWEVTW